MKKWYESKTIWVNTLTLIISITGVVVSSASDVGISPHVVLILTGVVIPILNVILRFITNEAISGTPANH